jgi:Gpi18-like mannosyltransferase
MLLFLFFLTQKKYLFSAVFGALAQATRAQGMMLFVAVCLYFLFEAIKTKKFSPKPIFLKIFPYLLIPLTLLLVFYYYQIKLNNFFAFFDSIKEFKHFQLPPFIRVYKYPSPGITTFWQEINVVDLLLYLAAALLMIKKKLFSFAAVAITYFVPLAFLAHMDISRYALPMLPFLFIAFSEIIETRYFRLALFIILPALYAYSYNFMCWNLGP